MFNLTYNSLKKQPKSFLSKTILETFLGVKRPPALLCTGRSEDVIADYEDAMTEPLHDFKNVINHVFEELPHAVKECRLNTTIREALDILKG